MYIVCMYIYIYIVYLVVQSSNFTDLIIRYILTNKRFDESLFHSY